MINCPKCKCEESFVIDSRPNEKGLRRRRVCKICNERYSTVESVAVFERGGDRRSGCGHVIKHSDERQDVQSVTHNQQPVHLKVMKG